MKKLVFLWMLASLGWTAHAQKTIEKTFDYKGQYIAMDVKFASHITVKTWDKNQVYFKANLEMDEPQYLDLYKLDIDEGGSQLSIASNAQDMFKKIHEDRKAKGTDQCQCMNGDEYTFNYTLYVPKKARFKVESINGDLKSDSIVGDFEAKLINGNIDIAQYSGNLDLSTINGDIDLTIKDARLVAETINGDIYGDEKLALTADKDRRVGHKVEGSAGSANTRLKLNTINGNMFLRM